MHTSASKIKSKHLTQNLSNIERMNERKKGTQNQIFLTCSIPYSFIILKYF